MQRPTNGLPPLVVFGEDWGRHISACQHLIRLLAHRYLVLWVNTIGTRRPGLDRVTFARARQKIRDWLFGSHPPAPVQENLRVINPVMWPWMRSSFDRWLNRQLLARQLRPVLATLPSPPVVITKVPIVADLMEEFPGTRWIYYCVDDFTAWPGLDQPALRVLEETLVRKAHGLIAVSEPLCEKLQSMGRQAVLLTHGVDYALWHHSSGSPAEELRDVPRPVLLFWGLIDRRLDLSFLQALTQRLEQGTVVLIGPRQDPDPALLRLPHIRWLPSVPHERLPALAHQASLLIMPYVDLPVTRAMQPLKLKEYLATELPVVVRDLPSNRAWADALDLTRSPEEFADRVLQRLQSGLPAEQKEARLRLRGESWETKAEQFEECIHAAWSVPVSSAGA